MAAIDATGVRTALEPVTNQLGLDLEDVSVKRAGRRSAVVVVLDKDGGLDLDAIAQASRAVSDALDDSGVTGDLPYVLEVSSPGVDRPLTHARHWRRAADRLVQLSLSDGSNVTGRVLGTDGSTVEVVVDGQVRTFDLAQVSRAVVQVEFTKKRDS
ncbi:MAG: ribosome maturation factor RimP [Candidatus Nanopelagicales bacterium]